MGTVAKPMVDFDHIEQSHEKSVLKRLVDDIPVFSRNYEDKLFRFDRYTAVTIAGAPIINDRNIGEWIKQEVGYYEMHFSHVPVETKIKYFRQSAYDWRRYKIGSHRQRWLPLHQRSSDFKSSKFILVCTDF